MSICVRTQLQFLIGIAAIAFPTTAYAANGARFEVLDPQNEFPYGIRATSVSGDGNVVVGVVYGANGAATTMFRWTRAAGAVDIGTSPGQSGHEPLDLTADGQAFVANQYLVDDAIGTINLRQFWIHPESSHYSSMGNRYIGRSANSVFKTFRICNAMESVGACSVSQPFNIEPIDEGAYDFYIALPESISIDGRVAMTFVSGHTIGCICNVCGPCDLIAKTGLWFDGVQIDARGLGVVSGDGNIILVGPELESTWSETAFGIIGSFVAGLNGDGSVGHRRRHALLPSDIWRYGIGWRSLPAILEDDETIELTGWTELEVVELSFDGRVLVGNGIDPQGNETAWRAVLPNPGWAQPFGIVADKATGAVRLVDLETGSVVRTFDDVGGGLGYPNGVVADAAHRAFVADVANDRVVQFDVLSGEVVRTIDGGGLDAPVDVIVSRNNTLLVASFVTGNVKEYDLLDGSFMRDVMPANSGGLDGAAGMALTADGALYVCSQRTDQVLEFDYTTGAFVRVAAEGCTLDGPGDVVVREDGTLFVTSFRSDEVLRFSATGVCTGCYRGGSLDGPEGLSLNLDGTLVVSNRYGGGVVILDADDCSLVRTISPGILEPTYVATLDAYAIDCNMNDIPDEWEIANGLAFDCNDNNFLDSCEIALGYNGATDPDGDGRLGDCVPPRIAGDMNCDGAITVSDIGGFVLALTNPMGYVGQFPACDPLRADINNDGAVSVTDIGSFVSLLAS